MSCPPETDARETADAAAPGAAHAGTAGVSAAGQRHLIARIWRGRTLAAEADAYTAYLHEAGVRKMAAIPGNRGAQLLRIQALRGRRHRQGASPAERPGIHDRKGANRRAFRSRRERPAIATVGLPMCDGRSLSAIRQFDRTCRNGWNPRVQRKEVER